MKAPSHYAEPLGELPPEVSVVDEKSEGNLPFIHLFAKNSKDLVEYFPIAKDKLAKYSMLWVSWKKIIQTGIGCMQIGIGDRSCRRKICAVDVDWSVLKFIYRKKELISKPDNGVE